MHWVHLYDGCPDTGPHLCTIDVSSPLPPCGLLPCLQAKMAFLCLASAGERSSISLHAPREYTPEALLLHAADWRDLWSVPVVDQFPLQDQRSIATRTTTNENPRK